jgi:hypothetical protein
LSQDTEKTIKETANKLGNPTLVQLIDKLVKDKGMKPKDATRTVYVLWKQGTLDIAEPNPPTTLARYVLCLESAWFWALTALVAITLVTVFGVQTSPLLYVRYALGGLFILLMPGATLLAALYPRGGEIDNLERLALSIGLSLAIVPLVGLVLNYTPWGIALTPIMASLSLFTEALAFVALVRKFRYFKLSQK